MRLRSAVLLAIAIVSPILVYFFWPSDEARIRRIVNKTASAAEAGDVEGVLGAVSFNYQDEHGMSYMILKKVLQQELARLKDIDVEVEGLDITVSDGAAGASADMGLYVIASASETDRGYWLGSPKGPFRLSVKFIKNSSGLWKVVSTGYDFRGAAQGK